LTAGSGVHRVVGVFSGGCKLPVSGSAWLENILLVTSICSAEWTNAGWCCLGKVVGDMQGGCKV
jgi:hypothetical protein